MELARDVNVVKDEKVEVLRLLNDKDLELAAARDMSVKLGCRIADLEEELVHVHEESEASMERSFVEIEEERQRRNDFEAITSDTVNAIVREKDHVLEEKKAVEVKLTRARKTTRELKVKADALERVNVGLQEALMKTPTASELYQAKRLVRKYAQHVADCSCSIDQENDNREASFLTKTGSVSDRCVFMSLQPKALFQNLFLFLRTSARTRKPLALIPANI